MLRRFLTIVDPAVLSMGAVMGLMLATAPVAAATGSRRADLDQLRHWMELEQSFSADTRAQAEALLARYERDAEQYGDAEFYMAVRRLVGLADNGHPNVSAAPIYERFGMLPLRTYWFSDGLYVVRARHDHADLLGSRIAAIDGRPVAELERLLIDYHGGNRAAFERFAAMA